ncbi:KH domain-containing protein HEN4, partial [Bienertia sinuspersici]
MSLIIWDGWSNILKSNNLYRNQDALDVISGDTLAVRKALLAVTYRLQGNTSKAISRFHGSVSSGGSLDLHAQKHLKPDTDARCEGQIRMDADTKKVAFRLLCSTHVAGGLIGCGGNIVKALEKETGACIEVSDPMVRGTERVIMVSATEYKEWQSSPAQDATLRCFTRLIEAASESGNASGSRGEPVTARLLIPSSQANLIDTKDSVGTEVQILESHCSSVASVDDKVVQIFGEYSDVHIYLLQVTWTLRESIFLSKEKKKPLLPHELYGRPPRVNAATTIADEMDNIKISCDTALSSPPVLSSESSYGRTHTKFMENRGDVVASSSSSEFGSGDEFPVLKNEELEVIIPAHVFGHVYGEGGGNLAILRQISGATIIVHDPCPGADGKVIICGTPNQTMAAKSMLYAFIMSRHDCVII